MPMLCCLRYMYVSLVKRCRVGRLKILNNLITRRHGSKLRGGTVDATFEVVDFQLHSRLTGDVPVPVPVTEVL